MNSKPDIYKGQIVNNLTDNEPVKILKIKTLGAMFSITYLGMHSGISSSRVISREEYEALSPITEEGSFNFNGNPDKFKLFAEAERINSAYQFDPLFAVNCSLVDPLPHQIEAVYNHLLPLPRIRFLLADDTGAGKTIMTGLLIKELLMRGLIERILIVTPGGLTKQWQEDELGLKFNLSFKLINRAVFYSDPNVFSTSSKVVVSIDFIRNDDVIRVLENVDWDLVVVDEAHKLSAFDYGSKRYKSKRYQAMEKIASKCEHLLLLTATPHRGRKDTFRNLLQLLDTDIFASDSLVTSRINEIGENGANRFFIRRLKEQMRDWNGAPLFKKRITKTVMYELTPPEKNLYDQVTAYLTNKRKEAKEQSNVYVTLALMVMQRRLASSIYAVKRTLKNRYDALNGLLEELHKNPDLWRQKQKLDIECKDIDDFYELDDEEREGLENILADPKKFKLFTTAKNINEIKEERNQVKQLYELAEKLYSRNQEEAKFIKLRNLLKDHDVLDKNEKLVIFTEHKDTLVYLEERLRNNGYATEVIHGGLSVDERREVQAKFAAGSQILIATDAAGEGINLQFCRLLINWDIPWNPNRLEQRMGRIHRYGQKRDVTVFNMVAMNTREGQVLQRLLEKLDIIREQMGDDRVYDVISDIFEDVDMSEIIDAIFNGQENAYTQAIDLKLTKEEVERKINEQKKCIACSFIDYGQAKNFKEESDEKRLQPIYIRMFFEKAFKFLGGKYSEIHKNIYKINNMPEKIKTVLKKDYNITADYSEILFCFDKNIFLNYQTQFSAKKMYYINPGNPIFDSLIKAIRSICREDMLQGTILISPDDAEPYFAYLIKSQITDQRSSVNNENVTDEKIAMVMEKDKHSYYSTSPAKFIDLYPPSEFAKEITHPDKHREESVVEWCFENITQPQFEKAQLRIEKDLEQRKKFVEEAFTSIILDLTAEINELHSKLILEGNRKTEEKIAQKQKLIEDMKLKRKHRIEMLDKMKQLSIKEPEVLGCAFVVPLNQVEYKTHYGMEKDKDAELIAMKIAMEYERKNGWEPFDVSAENAGYDIRSVNKDKIKRYIEVKGRSATGGVMLSENEMNRLAQLGDNAWLYIVLNCKSEPKLYRIQDPANTRIFEKKSKGIQYFLPYPQIATADNRR